MGEKRRRKVAIMCCDFVVEVTEMQEEDRSWEWVVE